MHAYAALALQLHAPRRLSQPDALAAGDWWLVQKATPQALSAAAVRSPALRTAHCCVRSCLRAACGGVTAACGSAAGTGGVHGTCLRRAARNFDTKF